ncbi:methyltransferase [Paraferrimonas sp. SM1919]|uniref:methyltransferase n=1 Tax=Paraferrimonas sp. SM1919 TaxID=2662263 RepID=UPI0013D046E9|nr:methyltransferase [Paraferrimonas sp. SM1919]
MSLTNPSILLERNLEAFENSKLLILNHEDDDFAVSASKIADSVTALALDFQHHQTLKGHNYVDCHFGTHLNKEGDGFDDIIIYFSKTKALSQYLLDMAQHLIKNNGYIWVVGENNSGIKTLPKMLTSTCYKSDSARRCSLYYSQIEQPTRHFAIEDYLEQFQLSFNQSSLHVCTLPGVFAGQKLDAGTELLLQTLVNNQQGRILDFGCGSGVLTAAIALNNPDAQIEAVDINAMALAACKLTMDANNLQVNVYPSNGLQEVQPGLQAIISNPPFHDGLVTTTDIATQFVADSKKVLNQGGLWQIVANAHLPYGEAIAASFGTICVENSNNKFKVYLQNR